MGITLGNLPDVAVRGFSVALAEALQKAGGEVHLTDDPHPIGADLCSAISRSVEG
jgi:hypothetical protein